MSYHVEQLQQELKFKAALSSGPGGQHANKANTKVILEWDLTQTNQFNEDEVARLLKNLKNRLTKHNILQLASDHTRSQHKNKTIVQARFFRLIDAALKIPRKRKKTKPSANAKRKRLQNKRHQSDKKANRKNPLRDL